MVEKSSAVDEFFAGFYRDPDPRVAGEALAHVLGLPGPAKDNVLMMFARAAQLSDGVRAEFTALRDREPAVADVVTSLLAAAANPAFPDPARIELTGPGDLDFLSGEFLLTGAEAPVHRIASVLGRDDRMLAALTAWVAERVYMPWSKAAKSKAMAALIANGIALDADRERLGNALDLDLAVWKLMSGGFKIRAELPFPIPDALINHMMIKGAACWSMQSNANAHPVVRAIYEALPDRARWPRFVADAGLPS